MPSSNKSNVFKSDKAPENFCSRGLNSGGATIDCRLSLVSVVQIEIPIFLLLDHDRTESIARFQGKLSIPTKTSSMSSATVASQISYFNCNETYYYLLQWP
eukprot:scaffold11949_cov69-Cylindrotheca_fusiformis.AAC.1